MHMAGDGSEWPASRVSLRYVSVGQETVVPEHKWQVKYPCICSAWNKTDENVTSYSIDWNLIGL